MRRARRRAVHAWEAGRLLLCAVVGALAAALAAAPATADEGGRSPRSALEDGVAAYRQGRLEDAIALWSEAESGYAAAGDARGRIESLLRRAEAYQRLGLASRALGDLERCRSLDLGAIAPDLAPSAEVLESRTVAAIGETELAAERVDRSVEQARADGDGRLLAAAMLERARLAEAAGRAAEAMESLRISLEEGTRIGDHGIAAAAAIDLAELALSDRPPATARAESLAAQAERHLAALPSGAARADVLLAVGTVRLTLAGAHTGSAARSHHAAAAAALTEAGTWARNHDAIRQVSIAEGGLAQLDEAEGRPAKALERLEEAGLLARRAGDVALAFRWDWRSARLLEALDRDDEAIAAHGRAAASLRALRTGPAGAGFDDADRQASRTVYRNLADLLLRRTAASAAGQEDLRAARDAIEQDKVAELEDYFGDACVAALRAKLTDVDRLTHDAAIVYPIILPDRLEVLVTVDERIHQVTVRVPAERIHDEIRSFRHRLERVTTRQYLPHARALYGWLVAPILPLIEVSGTDTLVVVPDGALRTIPFAALNDGDRFLGERYRLAITPGLSLLDVRPFAEVSRPRTLVGAVAKASLGFPPLPAVADEVTGIESIFPSVVLQDEAFTLAAFQNALKTEPFAIVHVASHGVLAADPRQSFVLAFDDRMTFDAIERLIKLSEFRREPVELLTLSACSTAAGDDRTALGFAGIGVKAGARSTLASLWSVNDEASATFVRVFYEALARPGTTKGEAVQQAQRALIDDVRFAHPGFWSAFVLIGNWL